MEEGRRGSPEACTSSIKRRLEEWDSVKSKKNEGKEKQERGREDAKTTFCKRKGRETMRISTRSQEERRRDKRKAKTKPQKKNNAGGV